ncbi:hypothetical protein scyTo_0020390 [Scyliorhinus torazame]|uniref:Aftiphilin clathrin-binding box domain-containing protein n=1 Tax=Scyliorhinus torazame TaxID=75743 RepID=A0A401PRI0_SCYTO|nr:hypothetical protein [Scyliorhinus torazame]
MDAKRPTRLGGAAARPAVEGEDRLCLGHTMMVEDGLYIRAGPKAEAEDGPCYPTGHTAEACVGPYHGVGSTVEAEGRLFHGGGPTAESEGRLYHGAGPIAETEGRPYHGAGPTAETEGRPYHGAGTTVEAEGRLYHGAGPTAETEGRPYHGAGPTAEAEGRPFHGAGPMVESEGRLYHGAGPTAEAEGRPYPGSGPSVEAEAECCHECGHTLEAGGGRCDGVDTVEAECKDPYGAGQDCAKCASEDGAFKEQTEPHTRQWRRNQNVQATEGTVTKVTDLSETQEGIRLPGLGTMETGTVAGQAQLRNATRTGEKVDTSDCEEHRKAEEPDDEFGSFEKAGNLVHWAEFPGPLWLEDESPHEQSGTAAGRSQESAASSDQGRDDAGKLTSKPVVWISAPICLRVHGIKAKTPVGNAHACDLWSSLQNVDQAVGLKYKWPECQSRKHLLASLCVDPANAETPAGHSRTLGSSLLLSRETTMELQPSPVSPGLDYKELMLIKNSVPQLQNGLSPTHRIQAFFYHWTQADRNGKSKTSYDFNKNFMA